MRRATVVEYSSLNNAVLFSLDADSSWGWGEGYFPDWDSLVGGCREDGHEPPPYAYVCNPESFRIDIDDIVLGKLEDWPDDSYDQLVDFTSLIKFVGEWNDRQSLKSWWPDWTRIVVIDEEKFNDFIANISD